MLNIAKSIYACHASGTPVYELPEAEIIPVGESANEKRKIANTIKKYPDIKELDNMPLPGFTLFKINRKNWGSYNETWLVIDPRGFLVRITNENLENILHSTGITEGLIQEKCVWAREDSQTKMTLIPISSGDYIAAVRNTELIENKVSIKDVQIGDTVILQNEMTGVYLGVMSFYGGLNRVHGSKQYKTEVQLRRQVVETSTGKYYHQSDVKILKVTEKIADPLTRAQAIDRVNDSINNGTSIFTGGHNIVRLASSQAVTQPTMTCVEVDITEAKELFGRACLFDDTGILVLENTIGKYLLDFPYFSNPTVTSNSFNIARIDSFADGSDKISLHCAINRMTANNSHRYSLTDFTKFYKIEKHVKGETFI